MDFPFNINVLFPELITKITSESLRLGHGSRSTGTHLEQISKVINEMGDASSKAQGLRTTITTANKLRLSDHHLYLLKDDSDGKLNGQVIGILKVGHKNLFILDQLGVQREVAPLCVLDFYVHESFQRQGCGKGLFDHMLCKEKAEVHHLAIDKPSDKLIAFLKKHYGLSAQIRQVNNFVVFKDFFSGRVPSPRGRGLILYSQTKNHTIDKSPPSADQSHRDFEAVQAVPISTSSRDKLSKDVHLNNTISAGHIRQNSARVHRYSRYAESSSSPTISPPLSQSPSPKNSPSKALAEKEAPTASLSHMDLCNNNAETYNIIGQKVNTSPGKGQRYAKLTDLPQVHIERRYEDLSRDSSWKIFGLPAGVKREDKARRRTSNF